MSGLISSGVLIVALLAAACSTSSIAPSSIPAAPSLSQSPTAPTSSTSILLTGQVTDANTGAPISGAIVSINGRHRAPTDASGHYSVTGLLDAGSGTDITYVSASGYVSDYRYIRAAATMNMRLYPVERITAGASTTVTVSPDDSLCVNNAQDSPGLGRDYVCRNVRVMASRDGVLTIEAESVGGGASPQLEVETSMVWRLENPTSLRVSSGTEVTVNVEMPTGSTASQSFVVKTTMSP